MIADTHVHVASHDTDLFPLHPLRAGGSEWWRNPVSAEDLLAVMDAHQVDRAVLVHALGAYSYDCRYTVEAARVDPDRLRAVVAVDMAGPDPAGALEALVDPVVSGVRLLAIGPGDTSWYPDDRSHRLWRVAGGGRAVSDRHGPRGPAGRLPTGHRVGRQGRHGHRPLRHARTGGGVIAASSPLLELADLPNVWVKVSTPVLLSGSSQGSPGPAGGAASRAVRPHPGGMGLGLSPDGRLDYAGKLALAAAATAGLSPDEREAVMAGNAVSLWFTPMATG